MADARFAGFVERLNRGSDARDRAGESFPRELLAEAGALGLFATTLPASLGGQALSWRDWGRRMREIARRADELAFPFLLSYEQSLAHQLRESGRADLLPAARAIGRGERLASFCWSEGADAFSFRTVARRGGRLVIDGVKGPVSAALFADLFVVYARDERRDDLMAVLVERSDPGVEVTPMEPLGLRALGQGELTLRAVELPEERILVASDGLSHAQVFLNTRRISIPCFVVGRLGAFFDAIVADLEQRVRYKVPVVEMQAVQARLGRMWATLVTCEAAVDRMLDGLAQSGAEQRPPAELAWDPIVAATKYTVVDAAARFIRDAQDLLGGRWYYTRWPYGRWMRDLLGLIPAAGTQAILEVDLGVLAAHQAHHRLRAATIGERP